MYGGDKDIDHQNAMAEQWTDETRAEYERHLDEVAAERVADMNSKGSQMQ